MTITLRDDAEGVASSVARLVGLLAARSGGCVNAERDLVGALMDLVDHHVDRSRLPSGDAPLQEPTGNVSTRLLRGWATNVAGIERKQMEGLTDEQVLGLCADRIPIEPAQSGDAPPQDPEQTIRAMVREHGRAQVEEWARGDHPPSDRQRYENLSYAARSLLWQVMNGDHDGAYRAKGTAAETEAIEARCAVAGDGLIWVAQEVAHMVPRREASRPPGDGGDGALLARFEVVGEVDDKSLHGWTEGDKQESSHDDLTITPAAWDVGTVFEVHGPSRPPGGATVEGKPTTVSAEVWAEWDVRNRLAIWDILGIDPGKRDGWAHLREELSARLASEGAAPPSEPDPEIEPLEYECKNCRLVLTRSERESWVGCDACEGDGLVRIGTTEPPATERDPNCPFDHLGPCRHEPAAEPTDATLLNTDWAGDDLRAQLGALLTEARNGDLAVDVESIERALDATRGAQAPTGDASRGAVLAEAGVVRYSGCVNVQDYRDVLARVEELEGAQAPDEGSLSDVWDALGIEPVGGCWAEAIEDIKRLRERVEMVASSLAKLARESSDRADGLAADDRNGHYVGERVRALVLSDAAHAVRAALGGGS